MQLRNLFWVVAAAAPAMARQAQWCADGSSAIDMCVAVDVDAIAQSTMKLGISLKLDSGWAAVASGDSMANASMVVVYANEAHDNLIVSARSTHEHHDPPQLDAELADKLIWSTKKVGEYWEVEVTCSECVQGDGSTWIWAGNAVQELGSNDSDAPLRMHGDFGRWKLDEASMHDGFVGAHIESRESWGMTDLPARLPEGESAEGHHHHHSTAIWLHGILMSTSFLLILPLGALAIRLPSVQAFKRHWLLQVLGGAGVVTAAALALSKDLAKRSLWQSFLKLHHGLGMVISAAIVAQLGLGYKHHVDYMKLGHRTGISDAHVWLGRLVIPFGWLNTAYGASFHNTLLGNTFFTWLAVAAISAVWVLGWRYAQKVTAKRPEHTSQDGHEMFELAEDDDDDDSDRENGRTDRDEEIGGNRDKERLGAKV